MNKKLAFTLIELLVVIAVIGILSGLIVVSMSGTTDKATMAKAQVFSNSLRNSLMANLISEWKLDGNGNDFWSGGNNGTITGATSSTDCVFGTCYSFDGNGDYISIPANSNQDITDAITMSVWVKTTTNQTGSYPFVFGKYWRYYISVPQGTNYARIALSGIDDVTSPTPMDFNKWNYIVGTYDKNGGTYNYRLYVNGALSHKKTFTIAISTTTNPMYFGIADLGWTTAGFIGLVDEAKLFNAAISSSQIKEQYYSGLNNLLINGGIGKEEYLSRINEYAIK